MHKRKPSRLFDVRIEYLGRKKFDTFDLSTICLGREGDFMVMDSDGMKVRFVASRCRVEQIAAHVIIIHGFTDYPRHITAYCVYANAQGEHSPGATAEGDMLDPVVGGSESC